MNEDLGLAARKHEYYPLIAGIRSLAVLSVLIFHLNESFLPGGSVGVDIFFVISGFVVTLSVSRFQKSSFFDYLKSFYIRRFFRIFPVLAVVLLVTSCAFVLFIPDAWLSSQTKHTGLAAIVGASNLVLAKSSDYFSPIAAFNPFTHTWSLGVEEQFYIIFPFIMYFGQKFNSFKYKFDLILTIVALITVTSLIFGYFYSIKSPISAFYNLPSRFWQLGIGMILCLTRSVWRKLLIKNHFIPLLLALLSYVFLAISLVMKPLLGFPVPWALLPVLGASGLIAVVVAVESTPIIRILGVRPMIWMGDRSYSVYLWHWPVIVVMRWTSGLESSLHYLIALSATFLLSSLSYRFIEMPARTLHRRGIPTIRLVAVMGISVVALTASVVLLFTSKSSLFLGSTRDAASWYPTPEWSDSLRPGCKIDRQSRSMAEAAVAVWTPHGCPTPPDGGRLFVAGDSHSIAYSRMLSKYALATGREISTYSLPGCAVIELMPRQPSARCESFERAVTDDIASRVGAKDVVFLPSLRIPRFIDQWGETKQFEPNMTAQDVLESSSHLINKLETNGARILFEGPLPIFKVPPFRCADWFNRGNAICRPGMSMERAVLDSRRAFALDAMRTLAAHDDRISVWDPFPQLCSETRCEALRDGKPLFFDQDHLSGYGNELLLPSFEHQVDRAFANQD